MQFISTQKYLRLSPNKIREVVSLVKKLTPKKAVETLPFITKRGSIPLSKVISTAIAQARQKGVAEDSLYFKEIQIGEGPRLKRGIPVSRGRWHPILKRMSHIRVVLETKEAVKETVKETASTNIPGEVKEESKKKSEEVKKPKQVRKVIK